MNNFTPSQMEQFARYVRVQEGGRYNMLDLRAGAAARLTRDQMLFVIENYDELAKQAAKEKQ